MQVLRRRARLNPAAARVYEASARSTGTFGRVLASARDKTVLVDGPPWNGCLGDSVSKA